jgi:hypothetical protein
VRCVQPNELLVKPLGALADPARPLVKGSVTDPLGVSVQRRSDSTKRLLLANHMDRMVAYVALDDLSQGTAISVAFPLW